MTRILTSEEVDRLTSEEALDYLAALEVLHKEKCRTEMTYYARHIEVPGTPSPFNEADRIKLLRRKQAMREKLGDILPEGDDGAELGEDLPEETRYYPQTLMPAVHHDLIMNSIQALMEEEPVEGPLANGHEGVIPEGVILMMPPGSAKSTYGSVVAPSWLMGRYPGTDVIGLSYAAELAKRFGRRVRQVCRSNPYLDFFNTTVTGDNAAVDQWSLTNGSNYRAVGMLGGVTGNRADIVFVDDPIAGREEAESEVIREKTNAALKDDVLTRLKPYGKVVMILTRWHEDDPAGTVLGEEWDGQSGLWHGADKRWWLVLRLPLLADAQDDPLGREEGERLWPEWFTPRHVELAREAGERSWMSLYQQRPAASEGVILLRKYWKCWQPAHRLSHGKPDPDPELVVEGNEAPKDWTQCVLVYDTAIEEGEENDYTAMTAWAAFPGSVKASRQSPNGASQQNLILLGGRRKKIQAAELATMVEEDVKFWMPDHIVIEKRASGAQLIQELRRRRPRYTDLGQIHYVNIHAWLPPFPTRATGKVPRLHSAAVALEQGTVWYMPGATTGAIIKEAAAAPNAKYDDWTDTVTCMLIWARTFNLLEVPADLMNQDEADQREREEHERIQDHGGSYGHNRAKPPSGAARALYGRAPRSKRHYEDAE